MTDQRPYEDTRRTAFAAATHITGYEDLAAPGIVDETLFAANLLLILWIIYRLVTVIAAP
jgi:hypothetical protein